MGVSGPTWIFLSFYFWHKYITYLCIPGGGNLSPIKAVLWIRNDDFFRIRWRFRILHDFFCLFIFNLNILPLYPRLVSVLGGGGGNLSPIKAVLWLRNDDFFRIRWGVRNIHEFFCLFIFNINILPLYSPSCKCVRLQITTINKLFRRFFLYEKEFIFFKLSFCLKNRQILSVFKVVFHFKTYFGSGAAGSLNDFFREFLKKLEKL